MAMRLEALLLGAGIECPENIRDVLVTSVTTDSRRVREGSMFIAIDGLHTAGTSMVCVFLAGDHLRRLHHRHALHRRKGHSSRRGKRFSNLL